jgi:polyhydroxyalkanoate synthase
VNTKLPATPDAWLEGAEQRPGSWWPEWSKWLGKYAGGKVDARKPGEDGLKAIELAPGSYARTRVS